MKEKVLPYSSIVKLPGDEDDEEEKKSYVRTIFDMSMAKLSATTTVWMKKMLGR